jgi:hypothetical protein
MSEDPNRAQNAVAAKLAASERQAGLGRRFANVKRELENLSDDKRKGVLELALGQLNSKLAVRHGAKKNAS